MPGIDAISRFVIFQGDSSPLWRIRIKNVDVSDCTCRQIVRTDLDTAAIFDEAVTDTVTDSDGMLWFLVSLTPTKTLQLTANMTYLWIVQIENVILDPPVRKETHSTLIVQQQGAV